MTTASENLTPKEEIDGEVNMFLRAWINGDY